MNNTIPVLDHGYIKLLNIAGPSGPANDTDPANAARMSFDQSNSGRTREDDLRLCDYLLRNHHCYHPEMEVLTTSGWVQWQSLSAEANFVVPHPDTKSYTVERLPVKQFDYTGELCCFSNNRMQYAVTPNHTMYFRGKYQNEFNRVEAQQMSKWGWFQPLVGFSFEDSAVDIQAAFVGFYLGDGCHASENRVSFHLKKRRKKEYLEALLEALCLEYDVKQSATYPDACVYWVVSPSWLHDWLQDPKARATTKAIKPQLLSTLSSSERAGLLEGLLASDGSIKNDRPQIQFSSASEALLNLVESLGVLCGYDAHRDNKSVITLFSSQGRTSLESRKQYHTIQHYSGSVYCATTSSGFLAVRGNNQTFGFVCGNSTPFEMVQVWLEMKLPIFVARQFVRHRTVSINEISGRYVELPKEWYLPTFYKKADNKKQGRANEVHHNSGLYATILNEHCEQSYEEYRAALAEGVAPEQARLFLHVNHYTKWLWRQDLHNLFHFLSLRDHEHAQWEAQQYAKAIDALLRSTLPDLMSLYDKYKKH